MNACAILLLGKSFHTFNQTRIILVCGTTKVRQDNEEMAAIERQITEAKEKRETALEEIRELEEEIQDAQGEKNEKYRELRLKETQIDEFLENFEAAKREEAGKV